MHITHMREHHRAVLVSETRVEDVERFLRDHHHDSDIDDSESNSVNLG